jgi:uncharacterized protein involved in copper resistance
MPTGMGRVRRVIAVLLALALLVLPGAPMRHASAAVPVQGVHQPGSGPHDAHGIAAHHASSPAPAAEAAHGHDDNGQPSGQIDGKLGLACCAAAQCPALAGAPPPATAGPVPMSGVVVRFGVPVRGTQGIDIVPTLPPPRAA